MDKHSRKGANERDLERASLPMQLYFQETVGGAQLVAVNDGLDPVALSYLPALSENIRLTNVLSYFYTV